MTSEIMIATEGMAGLAAFLAIPTILPNKFEFPQTLNDTKLRKG